MLKYLFLFIFFYTVLFAKNEQVVHIVANSIENNNTFITANGDVLVYSPHYYITAKKAIYNKTNKTLELFNKIFVIKEKELISMGDYAFLDMKNEVNQFTPILLLDKKTNIWFNASKAESEQHTYKLTNATISSCDCYDPSWSIGFSSGDYNRTNMWVNTYNAVLYVHSIPVFYTPYFGFPTDTTRRSGLLRPTVGYSKQEGLIYMQPIYFAPKLNYDIEYIPQIRTKRGKGHELHYRYKDSQYSELDFNIGAFYEDDDYYEKYNFINQTHHGWDLKYHRTKLLSDATNTTDGLKLYFQDMNDVEYRHTKKNEDNSNNKLLESNIKYFYNTNKYYADIEFKSYNDISKSNNDDVMQILPQIQLHKYSTSIFNLINHSLDIKSQNNTRKIGLGAKITNISMPLTYNKYLFNKLLGISFVEQFNFSNFQYSNTESFQDGSILSKKDIISLDISLLKPYENYIHTISFNTTFTKPSIITQKGDLYGINSTDSLLSIFPVTYDKKNISFSINQSLYSRKSLQEIINHKIKQIIVYDENNKPQLSNLENEIKLNFPYGTISNNSLYNYDDKIIIKSTSSAKLKYNDLFANIDYSYSKDKPSGYEGSYKDLNDSKSIIGTVGGKFFKYYTISYKEQYDIIKHISNIKEYKLNINKKCWSLDLKLSDSLVAAATTTNNQRRQNIIYATITLKPIVSFKQVYIQKEREE